MPDRCPECGIHIDPDGLCQCPHVLWEAINDLRAEVERLRPVYEKAVIVVDHADSDYLPEWFDELCKKLTDLDDSVEAAKAKEKDNGNN